MEKVFCRLFNLYPGEINKAFLFVLLAFVWSFAATCGVTVFDSLFIVHVGAEFLPQAFVYTALAHFIIAIIFVYTLHKVDFNNLYRTTIIAGIVIYVYFFLKLHFVGEPIVVSKTTWYILKILGVVTLAVMTSCYWNFVDQYYVLQNAKRFYGLFNAAIFAGVALGGATITLTIQYMHTQGVIFIVMLLLFLTLFIAHQITARDEIIVEDTSEGTVDSDKMPWTSIIRAIVTSRFTIFLILTEMVLYLLEMVTEYNYMNVLEGIFHISPDTTFIPGTDNALAEFIGTCKAWTAIGCILFNTLIYSRLVKRFGIANVYLSTPTYFLGIFLYWPFANGIVIAVLCLIAIEGVRTIIDDNCSNLMLNVVPHKIRSITRVMIDSFFEPAGVLISGLILMLPNIESKILGLCLSVAALIGTLLLRWYYPKTVFTTLTEKTMHFERTAKQWLNKIPQRERQETANRLINNLSQMDVDTRMLAYQSLLAFHNNNILAQVLTHINTLSPDLKLQALKILDKSYFATNQKVFDMLEHWQYNTSYQPLYSAIHFYFAKHGLFHPEKAINHIDDNDLIMRGAAIIALKSSWAHLSPSIAANNRTIASENLQQLLNSNDEAKICMGLTILGLEGLPHNNDILIPFLKNSNILIARTAAKSVAMVTEKHNTRYANELLSQLQRNSDPKFKQYCLHALGNMNASYLVKDIIRASIHFRPSEQRLTETIIADMGPRTVPVLLAITKDTTMHDRCRILTARILGKLALPQLRRNLLDIIHQEIDRAYFCYYHGNTIQQRYPEHDLSILENTLLSAFYSVIDFLIHLLAITGAVEDVELLARSLRSTNSKTHSHAVETIEETCSPEIFSLLEPLIDDRPKEEKLAAYVNSNREVHSLSQLLDIMENSSSLAKHVIAAALKARLNVPNWKQSLKDQMKKNDELFHHFAYELLEQ